ncbi:MAG: AraC family transcriptional regulator [Spirochaetaceae bacterium]
MSIDRLPIGIHANIEHGIQIFFHKGETILFSAHGHFFYEIFYVTEGKATHWCNNASSLIKKGSLIFIRPGDIHQYMDTSPNFSFYNLVFSVDTAIKLFSLYDSELISDNIVNSHLSPEVTLNPKEADILSSKFDKDIETTDIKTRSFFNVELLTSLLPMFITSHQYKKDILPNWFQELLELIDVDKNYTKGLTYIYSLATRSKEHVSRSFKKYFDTTPTDYINEKKLIYASNLLRQTNIEIIDIGDMAGFNSHSHFYHLFKKKFTNSPKQYRIEHSAIV